MRVGIGSDIHRLASGRPLMIGGIEIPSEKGESAHSDGDVLVHALCDALLGASALGDIGLHFPDTSDEYKGADSMILLAKVVDLLDAKSYGIVNVDCTLVMQKPKLRPYIDDMRASIAAVLKIPTDRVSVKATTEERLGFTGREEGVSAHAVALIKGK